MTRSHVLQKKGGFDAAAFQTAMLGWYAKYRRVLPWRALPGQKADPYHVWLSEIMLQQTTVQAVIGYFEKFTTLWPSVHDLAAADPDAVMQAWAGLGYYARARNLLKCAAQICEEHGGVFPSDEAGLLKLPGIGPYTSAAITAIAFGLPATVVDGNVDRVVSRVFAIQDPLPQSKPAIRAQAHILFQDVAAPGDFAQSLMDLGATVCTPQSPKCGVCPVREMCAAHSLGIQAELPRKAPKKPRPARVGTVYWLQTADGRLLVEKRAAERMLGDMPGLPTSDWDASGHAFQPLPAVTKQLKKAGTVYHTFTHFDLTLNIERAEISSAEMPAGSGWKLMALSDIKTLGLPTVFRKVVKLIVGA